jgi:23S rRNA A1618 N6-methylase RlmF
MSKHHNSSAHFNARMHPRNPYSSPINIALLARQFPDLCDHVISRSSNGHVVYDWHAPGATYAVTRALLKRDFDLEWQQPLQHLCPPVPGRMNYLLWVQDLALQDGAAAAADVCVADIGTGASAIFPLMGARRFGWSFVALDSNEDALSHARANVERNGLQQLIAVQHVAGDSSIIDAINAHPNITHTMCNPPFFSASSSSAWRQRAPAARAGGRGAMSACAAVEPELFTQGGEVAFMRKIIEESAASPCSRRVKWFTCMVGIKADLAALKSACYSAGATQLRCTTFYQGQTLRWGLAWTFLPELHAAGAVKRALEEGGVEADIDPAACTRALKRSTVTDAALQQEDQ